MQRNHEQKSNFTPDLHTAAQSNSSVGYTNLTSNVENKDSKQEKQILEISKKYSIEIPAQMICCMTLEVMNIPVIAPDGKNYEGSWIASWFARGNTKSPLLGFQIHHDLVFNSYVYDEIRKFFQSVLVKDADKLNRPQFREELAIIKKRAAGLTQDDKSVKDLIKFCFQHHILINALETLPKPSALEHKVVNITLPELVDVPPALEPVINEPPPPIVQNHSNYIAATAGIITSFLISTNQKPVEDQIFGAFILGMLTGTCVGIILNRCGYNLPRQGFFNFSLVDGLCAAATTTLGFLPIPWWSPPLVGLGAVVVSRVTVPNITECVSRYRASMWHRRARQELFEEDELVMQHNIVNQV